MGDYQLDIELYFGVIRETTKELKGIMDVSVKDRAKDFVKSKMGRAVRSKDPLFWPAGMLMLGLVEARRSLIEKLSKEEQSAALVVEIDAVILKHLNVWKGKYGAKVDYIDDALAGAAAIKLYQQSYDEKIRTACKMAADKIYSSLKNSATDRTGTIVYNSDRDSGNVFADGTGMVSMFLSAYGEAFEDNEALDLAALQLMNYKKYGMDERSGLPYHGYSLVGESGKAVKKGVLSWGRAAGWLIMGLSEFTKVMESYASEGKAGPELGIVSELVTWYRELSDVLYSYQRPEGGFAWQIQAVEGPLDTSATGMILYGLMRNEEQDFEEALKVLLTNIDKGKVVGALSSCDDFGVHYQSYGHFPWGQGAVLSAIATKVVM